MKKRRQPVIIHDDIGRRKKKPLYYTVKATSDGKLNRKGLIGVSEWHIYISDKPPEQIEECYVVEPAILHKGDEFMLHFDLDEQDRTIATCAFTDKGRVSDVTGKL